MILKKKIKVYDIKLEPLFAPEEPLTFSAQMKDT